MTLKSIFLDESLSDRSAIQDFTSLFTSIVSLVAATGEATIATISLFGRQELAKKLDNLGPLVKLGKYQYHLKAFKTLGFVASGITVMMTSVDAYEHLKLKDRDAALALGASALTTSALTAIGVGAMLNISWAAAVPVPVIWVLLALSIGLAALASAWRDKPLPDWVKHGPFEKSPYKGDYTLWRTNPDHCHRALMGQLVQPRLQIKQAKEANGDTIVKVIVHLPVFMPENDQLRVHTTLETEIAMGRGGILTPYHKPQTVIQPKRIIQHSDDNHQRIRRIEYHYPMPDLHKLKQGSRSEGRLTWRSRAQVKGEDMILPAEYKPGLYSDLKPNTSDIIHSDQTHWVHAKDYQQLI